MKKRMGAICVNIAVLAIAALIYAALASPDPVTAMARPGGSPIYKSSSSDRISLQCTVTWEASALVPMLDILREQEVNITFSVSGDWAQSNPQLVKRMAEDGHEIAVMGYTPEKDGGVSFLTRDIEAALNAVESACGERPQTYFCGSRESSVSARAGQRLGLTTVLCTADLDCSSADPGLLVKRLAACASPGSIINIQPTANLLNALPQIVNNLKNMGLAIVPVHKMLYN